MFLFPQQLSFASAPESREASSIVLSRARKKKGALKTRSSTLRMWLGGKGAGESAAAREGALFYELYKEVRRGLGPIL